MKNQIIRKSYNWSLRLRITSGIIIYFYVITHLVNHALGLHSLELMEKGRVIFLSFWRFLPIEILLFLAFLTHLFLAFYAFFKKVYLKQLNKYEWIQYFLGFLIPLKLLSHLVFTRVSNVLYETQDTYSAYLLANFNELGTLLLLLVVAMAHGTIGIYFYLRLKLWFRRFKYIFWSASFALPVLALSGLLLAHREIHFNLKYVANWSDQVFQEANPQNHDFSVIGPNLEAWVTLAIGLYLGLLVLVIAGRWLFYRITLRDKVIEVHYPNEKVVHIAKSETLLDASNQAGIPHAQICRGKGRCSTCRVQVIEGISNLSDPSEDEKKVLDRIKAPPAVRLACQTRPQGHCQIAPILPTDISIVEGVLQQEQFWGEEKRVVVLFADIRGFTALSEKRLPFDVVSLLNGYFKAAGMAIENNEGYLDKFIGDGTMAIFGLEGNLQQACRNAIKSAQQITSEVKKLNERYQMELETPLRVGIGIHCGDAIIGEMGYKHALKLTAIGDTVNTASRLESYTKEHQCELIVSHQVAQHSGYDFSDFPKLEIPIRGRKQAMSIRTISQIHLIQTETQA